MKYPYKIKFGGKWYAPGEEVPNDMPEVKIEDKPEIPPKVDDIERFSYNKNTINRMAVTDLQKLGKKYGIPNAEEKTGSELKKIFIARYNL